MTIWLGAVGALMGAMSTMFWPNIFPRVPGTALAVVAGLILGSGSALLALWVPVPPPTGYLVWAACTAAMAIGGTIYLWQWREVMLRAISVNVPRGLVKWPLLWGIALLLVAGAMQYIPIGALAMLLWCWVIAWMVALRTLIMSTRRRHLPTRRENADKIYQWLSRIETWPPPPLPQVLPSLQADREQEA